MAFWTHADKLGTSDIACELRMSKSGFGLLTYCTANTTITVARHLVFKFKLLMADRVNRAILRRLPNFVTINQPFPRFGDFDLSIICKIAAVRHLGFI